MLAAPGGSGGGVARGTGGGVDFAPVPHASANNKTGVKVSLITERLSNGTCTD
jgi:hypothetical protein